MYFLEIMSLIILAGIIRRSKRSDRICSIKFNFIEGTEVREVFWEEKCCLDVITSRSFPTNETCNGTGLGKTANEDTKHMKSIYN